MRSGFDTSQMRELIVDLDRTPLRAHRRLLDVVEQSSADLRDHWKRLARDTAGAHGPHYPNAITDEVDAVGLSAIIGPESGLPQGGMSFEYGSRNQPPHLDGNRAADVELERFGRRAAAAAEDVFRGLA